MLDGPRPNIFDFRRDDILNSSWGNYKPYLVGMVTISTRDANPAQILPATVMLLCHSTVSTNDSSYVVTLTLVSG